MTGRWDVRREVSSKTTFSRLYDKKRDFLRNEKSDFVSRHAFARHGLWESRFIFITLTECPYTTKKNLQFSHIKRCRPKHTKWRPAKF